jgi:chemotaxis protein methyltransferase CheR
MLRHFCKHPDGTFELSAKIRQSVQFALHNLSSGTPEGAGPGWDMILCRNVLIYFKPERALAVFLAMTRSLAQGGAVLLGASEVVYDVPEQLCAVYHAGRLVLQKRPRAAAPQPEVALSPGHAVQRPPLPVLPSTVQELTLDRPVPGKKKEARAEAEHLLRGHEQLDAGRIVEALEHYEAAVTSDPTWPEAHMYRGIARYLKGDVDAAAHDLRAALFLDSELWQAAFYLALSYESLGLGDAALREYRHVVRLCDRAPGASRKAHPMLVEWQGDVVELARRRLRAGAAAVK